jgi:methylmalonyl-CoA/ethylmalonyl-CoA epimerase
MVQSSLPDWAKNFELDHIGIAVKSLSEGFLFYQSLGFSGFETEEVQDQKVRVGFISLANKVNIELLEATSQDSPIAKFIAKRGEGIHHFCLRVSNIQAILDQLKVQGVRLIDQVPRLGAHNCLVAFVHPSAANGVLIELSQQSH